MRMKHFTNISILFFLCLSMISCVQSNTGTLKEAQKHFIGSVQYMTAREALSKEINYYKDPQITVARKVADLTGEEAIHECNIMLQENDQVMKGSVGEFRIVDEAKNYALDHPYKIVGAKYYFEGLFTHFNNGYDTRRAYVLCLNGHWYVKQVYH